MAIQNIIREIKYDAIEAGIPEQNIIQVEYCSADLNGGSEEAGVYHCPRINTCRLICKDKKACWDCDYLEYLPL